MPIFKLLVIKQDCPKHNKIHYRVDVEHEDVENFEKWFGLTSDRIARAVALGEVEEVTCRLIKSKKEAQALMMQQVKDKDDKIQ